MGLADVHDGAVDAAAAAAVAGDVGGVHVLRGLGGVVKRRRRRQVREQLA